jgi:hypothetical protein
MSSLNLTNSIEILRGTQFESSVAVLGYKEMGHQIVNELLELGLDLSKVETIAYRMADSEPPITGKSLELYQEGVSSGMRYVLGFAVDKERII